MNVIKTLKTYSREGLISLAGMAVGEACAEAKSIGKTDGLFRVEITVAPFMRVSFPLDMLRYDRLTPLREADSSQILLNNRYADEATPISLLLLKAKLPPVRDELGIITIERWESFGWVPVPKRIQKQFTSS